MTIVNPDESRIALQTRKQFDIKNVLNRSMPTPGMQRVVSDLKRNFVGAIHRDVGPCASYNCHGLTFAARRTAIDDPADVAQILEDDDYEPVAKNQVCPGDIAVYYNDGDIEHSGIVVDVVPLSPIILSKWGPAHEVIHNIGNCPYDANDVKYFRIRK